MTTIKLPSKQLNEKTSLGYTLEKRGSCRYFDKETLTLKEVSNILWVAQGITDKQNNVRRTVASAGAIYPIELYVSVRERGVHELQSGIYRYNSEEHTLQKISDSDITEKLSAACFNQKFIEQASFNILIASDNSKTEKLYKEKGDRYVFMEAGATTQNIYLEAVELNLGTVVIGAFDDDKVKELFEIDKLMPVAIMPVGSLSDKKFYI